MMREDGWEDTGRKLSNLRAHSGTHGTGELWISALCIMTRFMALRTKGILASLRACNN